MIESTRTRSRNSERRKGQRDRQRVGDTGALDDQIINLLAPLQHPKDGVDQVVVQRAANTAVAQLHHVVVSGNDQLAVDPDLAELVDNDGSL
jgi:hypothetical protein